MLASFGGAGYQIRVGEGGRGYNDYVDVRRFEDTVRIVHGFGTGFFGPFSGEVWVQVKGVAHGAVWVLGDNAGPHAPHIAAAEQANVIFHWAEIPSVCLWVITGRLDFDVQEMFPYFDHCTFVEVSQVLLEGHLVGFSGSRSNGQWGVFSVGELADGFQVFKGFLHGVARPEISLERKAREEVEAVALPASGTNNLANAFGVQAKFDRKGKQFGHGRAGDVEEGVVDDFGKLAVPGRAQVKDMFTYRVQKWMDGVERALVSAYHDGEGSCFCARLHAGDGGI